MSASLARRPRPVRRVRLGGLIAVVALLSVVGCSGSSKHSAASSAPAPSTTAQPPSSSPPTGASSATEAAVAAAYTTLFDGTAALTERVGYLQNPAPFEQAFAGASGLSIINETSATVSDVTLTSPNVANVVFTVSLKGTPLLVNQNGTAVYVDGGWKVSASTFCGLLKLEGQAPAACSQPATTAMPT